MIPLKKILCPIDFSNPSYGCLQATVELAQHFSAGIVVLHVIPDVPTMDVVETASAYQAFDVPLYQKELKEHFEKSLEKVVAKKVPEGIPTHRKVVHGNAADEILRTATEEKVDLIVIATHGRTGIERLMFGSVAEKVVRMAPCPVLTTRIRPPEEGEAATVRKEGVGISGEKERAISEEEGKVKKAYQERIEVQLREWGAKIDALKEKADSAKADVKMKYETQIKELRQKQETVRKRLRDLAESGGGAWEELKSGVEKSLDDLKEGINRAVSKFKKK